MGDEEEDGTGYPDGEAYEDEGEDDDGEDTVSVHVRMVCRPRGEGW